MNKFILKFKNLPELIIQLDDTAFATKYYRLLKTQYTVNPQPIVRDKNKYTPEYFLSLVPKIKEILGWDWSAPVYDYHTTNRIHRDLEDYLKHGFKDVPASHDWILDEAHQALHFLEDIHSKGKWVQVEWHNNHGFPIKESEFPGTMQMSAGDIRLHYPHVGYDPTVLYQKFHSVQINQTCKLHDFAKPGFDLFLQSDNPADTWFNIDEYIEWFNRFRPDVVAKYGEEKLKCFVGHAKVGSVTNLSDLEEIIAAPLREFEYLKF